MSGGRSSRGHPERQDRIGLLGGAAAPLGCWVSFLQADLAAVERALRASAFATRLTKSESHATLRDGLLRLVPLETPWTKVLLVGMVGWTAVLNNSLLGGDPSAPGPLLSKLLECRLVVAGHFPRNEAGRATTAMFVHGPDGEPPLNYRRTLQVYSRDDRWGWEQSGAPFEFEDVGRYARRLKKARFDRELLLEYLTEFGIGAELAASYGQARLLF